MTGQQEPPRKPACPSCGHGWAEHGGRYAPELPTPCCMHYRGMGEPCGCAELPAKTFEDLIEASSLGTPEAKALRESVPQELVDRVIARMSELKLIRAES